jgi:hypothetical protein
MSIGAFLRVLLGPKWFPVVGRRYRRIFVDLDALARAMSPHIPDGARILDIGGGDGEPLNNLLALRPDLTVTLIDEAPNVGGALRPDIRECVELYPGVNLDQCLERDFRPSVILVLDVVHHVRAEDRSSFFAAIGRMAVAAGATVLVKDIEPGHFISWLSYLSDRLVTGDKHVALVSSADLGRRIADAYQGSSVEKSDYSRLDGPNYLLVVRPQSVG